MPSKSVRISVISPGRRQGSTMMSILLGLFFENTQHMSVCLTHAGNDNDSIQTYLGKTLAPDKTRSLEQIYRLIEYGQISSEDIVDYSQKLAENLYLMDTAANYMSKEQSQNLLMKILDNLDFDVIITDLDTEIYEDITQELIRTSDLVIVVVEQATDILNKMKAWRASEYYDVIENVGEIFIVNKFHPSVGSMKNFAKQAGISLKYTNKIDYNTLIQKLANEGKLASVMAHVKNHALGTLGLTTDMKRIMELACLNLSLKFTDWDKREVEKSKAKEAVKNIAVKRKR